MYVTITMLHYKHGRKSQGFEIYLHLNLYWDYSVDTDIS